MTTTYLVKLTVTLCPVHHSRPLPVKIGIDDQVEEILIDSVTVKTFEFYRSRDTCNLHIEFTDKKDQEAVIIQQVSFFDIEDPKFAWAGIYLPQYPEPWATEQNNAGIVLKSELCSHTYLSWPGQWTLTFGVPVFTWIHDIQNLGWIYD